MAALRNLTYQEQLILQAITLTTPMALDKVCTIYKVVGSYDQTIAVINEAQQLGESVLVTAKEMG